FDGTKIDALFQLEAQTQQDAFFQHARPHVRMPNGPEQDGRKLAQLGHDAVGQRFLGAQVTVAAQIEGGEIELDGAFSGGGFQDFDGFARDFRARAVATNDSDVVAFHDRKGSDVCNRNAAATGSLKAFN